MERERREQEEDTHYSAICAAEKHKDMPRCVCVRVCFISVWVMDR